MELLKNPHYDFLAKTRLWVSISLILILGSIGLLSTRGLRYGVEFSGGTQIVVKFKQRPRIDKIRAAVETRSPGAVIQTYDEPSKNQVLIRLAETSSGGEQEASQQELDSLANQALQAIGEHYPENPVLESSSEIVGPVVGAELRKKAIQLTILALLFQLIYIAVRFNGAVWGLGATVAVFHDVIITMGFLMVFDYEITLNVIAALLTIVGYSVNDTIVVFDRARENLRLRRKEPLSKVLNDSLNQTLSRTLISSGTTFLAVLALFVFGGEALKSFAFTMVVGVVVGTYSSIYIASPIVLFWRGRKGGGGASSAKAAL
jgi:preprotein translocase subunit SecF